MRGATSDQPLGPGPGPASSMQCPKSRFEHRGSGIEHSASNIPFVETTFKEGGVELNLLAAPDLESVIGEEPDLERPPYCPALMPRVWSVAKRSALCGCHMIIS